MKVAKLFLVFILFFIGWALTLATKVRSEPATVLLVLEPTKPGGGKWDYGVGADPVVCLDAGCYRSRGFQKSARFYEAKSIFFPGIRAAACRNSKVCVFRGVDIPARGAEMHPVDLDGFEHDHLTKNFVRIDKSCEFRQGKLICYNGVYAEDYAMWVVPDSLADAVGKSALDYALFKGIEDEKHNFMGSFLRAGRRALPEMVSRFYSAVLEKGIPTSCVTNAEIISEAFHLTGIVGKNRRAANLLFEKYVEAVRVAPILKTVKVQPALFWALHDAMERFRKYASVSLVQLSETSEGVQFVPNPQGKTSLLIGWQVKSRAKALLADCLARGA